MNEEKARADGEASQASADAALSHVEEGYDDAPEERMQALVAEHARERAALADRITRLWQENQRLLRAQPNTWQQTRSRCYHLRVSPQTDTD